MIRATPATEMRAERVLSVLFLLYEKSIRIGAKRIRPTESPNPSLSTIGVKFPVCVTSTPDMVTSATVKAKYMSKSISPERKEVTEA